MNNKHKLNNSCNFLKILYILYFGYLLKYITDLGYINPNTKIYEFMSCISISSGMSFVLFQVMFAGIVIVSVEAERKDFIIY